MNKTRMEIVNEFKNLINDVKVEVDIIEKASKYVIIYQNEEDKDDSSMYGITSTDMNMISEIHNVMPTPSLNNIAVFNKEDAKNYAFRHRLIKNGFGSIYESKIMTYGKYAKMYLDIMTKSYQSVIEMMK